MAGGHSGTQEPEIHIRSFAPVPGLPTPRPTSPAALGRIVVAVVIASVAVVTATAWAIGLTLSTRQSPGLISEIQIGGWRFLISDERPPGDLIILSLLGIVAIALISLAFEGIAALMSIAPRRRYLAAQRARGELAEIGARVRVTVLVPAHNEEHSLSETLASLARQTRPPDRVVVVADNCTDRTADIAREMGHEAFETVGNTQKKGGALNQALARILPVSRPEDVMLILDADTRLGPQFIEVATARLEADPDLAAVGGLFYGDEGHGILGQFQRNEYTRYSTQIRQRRGRVFVLTGTATMFRAEALLDVAAARDVFLPGEPGKVYDTAALTEDNELTLALKSLGATMTSPPECYVVTELMPTWRALWRQRQRWQRGALENLAAYGLTRATLRYWGQQLGIGYGTIALNSALLLLLITFVSIDTWIWFPFWLGIGALFWLERVATAWRGGWRARLLAAALIPELAYDVFLQIVFISCLWDISTNRTPEWGHVIHGSSP